MTLFDEALSPQNIQSAWEHLRSDKAPWTPDTPHAALEHRLPFLLSELVDDLRSNRFRPLGLRQFPVQKGDGTQRIISAQYLRDKFAQRLFHQVLHPKIDPYFHPDSFGYRRGRSVQQAIARVRERIRIGLTWLVDADIRSFFDQVPHRGVRKILKRYVSDRQILKLIDRWMLLGAHRDSLLGPLRGVPQGTTLSPLLCNLFLHNMDERLSRAGIPFVRYADDFVLQTSSREDAEASLVFVRKILSGLRLELNENKTRVCEASPQVIFLGEPVLQNRIWRRY